MKNSPVEWMALIFNGIIAVVALVGFAYTIFSNKEVTKTLETIKNTFETYSDPILQFDDYRWFFSGQKMDCANPPSGINFTYKNISNFPIKLLINKISLIFESQDFYQTTEPELRVFKAESLIAPQSTLGFSVMRGDNFKSIFKKKGNVYSKPFLEIHIDGIISNLSGTKKFRIKLIDFIGFDCNRFDLKNIINYEATYSPI